MFYVCLCVPDYLCLCVGLCMCIYVCVFVCRCLCVDVCVCVCMCVCLCVTVCVSICAYRLLRMCSWRDSSAIYLAGHLHPRALCPAAWSAWKFRWTSFPVMECLCASVFPERSINQSIYFTVYHGM